MHGTTTAPPRKALWLRLRRYQFDHLVPPQLSHHVAGLFGPHDASTRAFAGKLRRKLGWSGRFALRAIDEYRKFLYLGVISDTPVTPSKVIDQVWHEHLLFTRGYREFCRDVLQHEFDHHPELVPMDAQTAAFSEQYERTLQQYATEFNVAPPEDIWGTPKFPITVLPAATARARRVERARTPDGDAPLHLWFDGSDGSPSASELPEFGGSSSAFAGAGGGDSWGDSDGGSDGGSSGCSSSCGGCGGD